MRPSPTWLTLAIALSFAACDGGRLNPGGGRPRTGGTNPDARVGVAKDATVGLDGALACACDLTTICDQGCACDPECLALPPDSGVQSCLCDANPVACDPGCACDPLCGGGCACDLSPGACDPGCACDPLCAGGCTCDMNAAACDPGCACDPMCSSSGDAGIHDCSSNPRSCADRELRGADCGCLGVCEPGWQWVAATRSCQRTDPPRPDSGVNTPDSGAPCFADSQCNPPSTVCDAQSCVPGCASPGGMQCGIGSVCNTATGRCRSLTPPDSGVVGPPDSGVLPSDPFNPTASAPAFAAALCDYRARCEPALLQFENLTAGQCQQEVTAGQLGVWIAYGQAVQANRVVFSQSAFNTCVSQMASEDCQLGLPDACDDYLTGTVLQGGGCSLLDECAPGFYCTAAINQCGNCQPKVPSGGDCTTAACLEGLVCATAGTQQVCVARDSNGLGAACGQINTGLCRGRLQCINAVCARPAGPGATCDQNRQTAADCDIFNTYGCVNGTCTQLTWVGPNAACGDTNQCDIRGGCDATSMTCTAFPTTGSCVMDRCAPTAYCDNGTCRAKGGSGASCTDVNGSCNLGLFCDNSTCGMLRHITCP